MDLASLETEVAALRARVRHLEDAEDIRRLRMNYHYFINDGLFERAAEIYTEDALVVWSTAGTARGHAEIVELFKSLPRRADFVKHFLSNHIVDVTGDEATGLAYVDARYAERGLSVFIAAKYNERYRRTKAGWRISETLLDVYFWAPLQEGWADKVVTFAQVAALQGVGATS
jgi:ketosteroid isomerase-like protein